MSDLYFAYGSNMSSRRMLARVPEARPEGPARLHGHHVRLNKQGRDGSAKANLVEQPSGVVWGVLYTLAETDWPELDRFEGGYARLRVEVVTSREVRLEAGVYVSTRVTGELAFDWYRALLLEGAREHGLPADYIAMLERLPARADGAGQ